MSAQFLREQKALAEAMAKLELRLTRQSAALTELILRIERLERPTLHLKDKHESRTSQKT